MKCLYVMDDGCGTVKVGISKCPEDRAKQISWRTGSAVTLKFASQPVEKAETAETVAHRLLADKQRNGEWFTVSIQAATDAILTAIDIVEGRKPDVTADISYSKKAVAPGYSRKPTTGGPRDPTGAKRTARLRERKLEVGLVQMTFMIPENRREEFKRFVKQLREKAMANVHGNRQDVCLDRQEA